MFQGGNIFECVAESLNERCIQVDNIMLVIIYGKGDRSGFDDGAKQLFTLQNLFFRKFMFGGIDDETI